MTEKEEDYLDEIERNRRIIARICWSYADSADDFRDLRQDVLLNLWRGWDRFNGDSKRSTWIYRVALNTCLTRMTRAKTSIPTEPVENWKETPQVLDYSDQSEDLKMLYELISQLSPMDKAIIIMWLDEFSYEEIASTTGLLRNTVAVRISRIKEKLKTLSQKI